MFTGSDVVVIGFALESRESCKARQTLNSYVLLLLPLRSARTLLTSFPRLREGELRSHAIEAHPRVEA